MKTIEEILDSGSEADIITALKEKTIDVLPWKGVNGLQKQYEPSLHPVMDRAVYPDIVRPNGRIDEVTRIGLGFQKLAVKRMTELLCAIPVKRVYRPANERQSLVATALESIFQRNRIDSINVKRLNELFCSCEIMTLWYATKTPNTVYGFQSPYKLRCRTFSPVNGDELYPFFDEYGDMVAMSVAYKRKEGKISVSYFDAYTETRHIKWRNDGSTWQRVEDEKSTVLKIPAVYIHRPTPIWEDTSSMVYEMEWSLSRNGNYLRENAKPKFVVYAEEIISYGDEKGANEEGKAVLQLPPGTSAGYATWSQAVESLKFHIEQLRGLYFTQLQLPDWSYEKMSQQALSGESRKQMFIDAELKVGDESGSLIEGFDREVNVVKAFLKLMMGQAYHSDIDELRVDNIITPYRISDAKEQVEILMTANGNMPLMSQRESIEAYGKSDNVSQTLDEIRDQQKLDAFNLTD